MAKRAKKEEQKMMKDECPAWLSWVVLIVGVIYLLQDLGIAGGMSWWTLNWWTVLFLVIGLSHVAGK